MGGKRGKDAVICRGVMCRAADVRVAEEAGQGQRRRGTCEARGV